MGTCSFKKNLSMARTYYQWLGLQSNFLEIPNNFLKGNLEESYIKEAICAGFEEPPSTCNSFFNISNGNITFSLRFFTYAFLTCCLFISFGCCLLLFRRRKIKRELDL